MNRILTLLTLLLTLSLGSGCVTRRDPAPEPVPPAPLPVPPSPLPPGPTPPTPIPTPTPPGPLLPQPSPAGAISRSQLDGVPLGASEAAVEAALGVPFRRVGIREYGTVVWLYRLALESGSIVEAELTFRGGLLTAKVVF